MNRRVPNGPGRSGRQGPDLMRCKSSFCQLSGFGQIAYPMHGGPSPMFRSDVKATAAPCLYGVGAIRVASKTVGLNRSEWLQSRKHWPHGNRCAELRGNADPLSWRGRPMFCWEETDTCTSGIHRDMDPDTQGKISGDNVGKVHVPAGADSYLQRSIEPDSIKVGGRDVDWRMSPDERRRAGNSAPGGLKDIHAAVARGGKGALGTWWAMGESVEGTLCP